jgi:hypothetical protein
LYNHSFCPTPLPGILDNIDLLVRINLVFFIFIF